MRKYINPETQILDITPCDIITTSPGTETTPKEDTDGVWDLDVG